MLDALLKELFLQREELDLTFPNASENIQILISEADDGEVRIGTKRNQLLQEANGEYVCFFDDDDQPSHDYLMQVYRGCLTGADCCSLKGVYTINFRNPEIFEHSLKYKEWKTTTNEVKYERYPNHLNAIKREIAVQFKFPEISHGEDHDWSRQVFESRLIKSEHYIDGIIYFYKHITNKTNT